MPRKGTYRPSSTVGIQDQPSTKMSSSSAATDQANVVCTVVALFAEYCGFRVEPVDVEYVGGVSQDGDDAAASFAECDRAPRDARGIGIDG